METRQHKGDYKGHPEVIPIPVTVLHIVRIRAPIPHPGAILHRAIVPTVLPPTVPPIGPIVLRIMEEVRRLPEALHADRRSR